MAETVTIYTKPGCPFCAAAKDDYQKRGIKYREIDVYSDPAGLKEMVKLSGRKEVPVIVEGNKVSVGFGGS